MTDQAKNSDSIKGEQPRKRIPLGSRNILTAPKKVGFVRRFVNDTGDRIQIFKDAGWNTVDDGSPVGDSKIGRPTNIGSATNPSVGNNQRAVLMELPEEIYEADRAESQAKIKEVENQIKRNSRGEGKDGLSGSVTIS
jgi:hypothetical protein